jgi:hypothetical protein
MHEKHQDTGSMAANDLQKIGDAQCVEVVKPPPTATAYISPEEIQGRFPLLRDLTKEQMDALNKKVLRKIDWRLLPMVSLMYLMKYVLGPHFLSI